MIIVDIETRSHRDVKEWGVDAMLAPEAETEVTMVGYKRLLSPGPAKIWVPSAQPVPAELEDTVETPFLAVNSRFDRTIWNGLLACEYATLPTKPIRHWYDVAVMTRASGLPSSLDAVLKTLGLPAKKKNPTVTRTFSKKNPLGPYDPEDSSWATLAKYLAWDVEGVEAILRTGRVRRLSNEEWEEFFASEEVNDRGLPLDTLSCGLIAGHLSRSADRFEKEFKSLTGLRPTQSVAINKWVYNALPRPVKPAMEREGGKISLDKRDALPGVLGHPDTPLIVKDALGYLTECRKSSTGKYVAMIQRATDGYLKGAYVFCGAPATGRDSSKGAQVHNMPKKTCDPAFVYDAELLGHQFDAKYDWRSVPATASQALRLMICDDDPTTWVVWSDWSAIEARVLPWLTLDPRAEKRLAIFRNNGDIYMHTVEEVYGEPDRSRRQHGKTLELALGFLGGTNALDTFGRNFGIVFSADEKEHLVQVWREKNPWAVEFGDRLMDAFINAFLDGETTDVGRIRMAPGPIPESVQMILPDGRPIIYPWVEVNARGTTYKKFDGETGKMYDASVWRGLLSENATQGTAASLLRYKRREGLAAGIDIRGATHDELIALAPDDRAAEVGDALARHMVTAPAWLEGCPLNAEWSAGRRYGAKEIGGVV